MTIEKGYLHDRVVLLLLSIMLFLALFAFASVLFRIESGSASGGIIVQYRPSLGIGAYKTGSRTALLGFLGFTALVAVFHSVLSIKAYPIRRQLTVAILAMGIVLLLLSIIVSNALLALH